MTLETFKKLPLGGVDRRSLITLLAEKGRAAAEAVLKEQLSVTKATGASVPDGTCVLILGGSNGITRAIAAQLLFGEGIPVVGVHYDSAKMQIGSHHVAAMKAEAEKRGVFCEFLNRDATRDKTITEVIELLKSKFKAVHFINGIAAGATKRYEKHGTIKVMDIDIAFDSVLQVPDFENRASYRKVGLVDVDVATEADIERTNKFMGSSSLLWAEQLDAAGLFNPEHSAVTFCDYDYEEDDPVYGMGPLAGAKILQRETMAKIRDRFKVRTVRLCYPAMATTALGAIPGGLLMYGLTEQILREQGKSQTLHQLAERTMALWQSPAPEGELRLDEAYQACLPEFHRRKDELSPDTFPQTFASLYE